MKDIIKNSDTWKIMLMVSFLIIMLMAGGYTINTKWGSVFRENVEEKISRKMTKIKTQTNYSSDMKTSILCDLVQLYEEKTKIYIKKNNLQVPYSKIKADIKYYQLIVIAMNDACEDITINRYIHNNDLYRYVNKNDWDVFKNNVVNLYIREGKQIVIDSYDNTKVLMPLHVWMEYAGKELIQIIAKNTEKLLEDLKIESNIYYLQENGNN